MNKVVELKLMDKCGLLTFGLSAPPSSHPSPSPPPSLSCSDWESAGEILRLMESKVSVDAKVYNWGKRCMFVIMHQQLLAQSQSSDGNRAGIFALAVEHL